MPSVSTLISNLYGSPSHDNMAALVQEMSQGTASDHDIAELAIVLAGEKASGPIDGQNDVADIASTGGPSSLSTLIGPLYLGAMGWRIRKIGVPGRPAGGIDVMAQVPGYRVNLSNREIEACIESCGYVHFLANESYAPLDRKLFGFRQTFGYQSVPELVIASLLSKKIAAHVARVGLDVRVGPHGNFGSTWEVAESNSRRFCRIASLVGISAVCFLTDATKPYQPYIGRGESLVAMNTLLYGDMDPLMQKHANACMAMANSVSGSLPTPRPPTERLTEFFESNLRHQGAHLEAFTRRVRQVLDAQFVTIRAERDGFLTIDMAAIRKTIVRLQSTAEGTTDQFPDPAGVQLLRTTGDYVKQGDAIAKLRIKDSAAPEAQESFADVFQVGMTPNSQWEFQEVRDV